MARKSVIMTCGVYATVGKLFMLLADSNRLLTLKKALNWKMCPYFSIHSSAGWSGSPAMISFMFPRKKLGLLGPGICRDGQHMGRMRAL